MEDSLYIKEKKYISAKRAAGLTGYTSDYVGQLARAKKISSQIIGRKCYVSEDEILSHRSSSTSQKKIKSKKNNKKSKDSSTLLSLDEKINNNFSDNEGFGITSDYPSLESRKDDLVIPPLEKIDFIKYEKDDQNLFPELKSRTGSVSARYIALEAVKNKIRDRKNRPTFEKLVIILPIISIFLLGLGGFDFNNSKVTDEIGLRKKVKDELAYLYGPYVGGVVNRFEKFESTFKSKPGGSVAAAAFYSSPFGQVTSWVKNTARFIASPWLKENGNTIIVEKNTIIEKTTTSDQSGQLGQSNANASQARTVYVESSDKSYVGYVDQKIAELKNYFLTDLFAPNVNRFYVTRQNDVIIDRIANSVGSSSGSSGGSGATSLDELSDIALSSPAYGDVLYYNGSNWANIATSSLGIVGGGGSGAGGYDFPLVSSWGNSTSTTLGFSNGFISTASSTITSTLHLPSLSQGFAYIGSNGLLSTAASSSLFGYTPLSNSLTKGYFVVGDDSGTAQATSSVFVSSTGSIGIGTTNPLGKLSVVGKGVFGSGAVSNVDSNDNVYLEGSGNYSQMHLYNNGIQGYLSINNEGTSSGLGNTTGGLNLWTNSNNPVKIGANGQEVIRVTPSALVGIGTTTPWGLLSVNANGLSSGAPQFVVGSSTATNFIVANNGNVGVGTVNPGVKFHIEGTSASTPLFKVQGSDIANVQAGVNNSTPFIKLDSNLSFAQSTIDFQLAGVQKGALRFNHNSGTEYLAFEVDSEVMRLQKNGNVGIGATSPLGRLHVVTTDSNGNVGAWDSGQLVVGQSGSTGGVAVGYSSSNNYGFIEAGSPGTAWRNLAINPYGGNVGIGTTTPQSKLSVVAGESENAILSLSADDGDDGSDTWFINSLASGNQLTFTNSGTSAFELSGFGILTLPGVNARFTLYSNSDPTGLDFDVQAASLPTSSYVYSSAGTGSYPFSTWGNLLLGPASGADVVLGRDNDLVVKDSGNIGVGTTTPWGLLSVNANGLSSGAPQFVVGSSTATNFIVDNSGKVGIGTLSPLSRLFVASTDNETTLSIAQNNSRSSAIELYSTRGNQAAGLDSSSNNGWTIRAVGSNIGAGSQGNDLQIIQNQHSNPAAHFPIMTFDSSDYLVGVGQNYTSPLATLDVKGDQDSGQASTPVFRIERGRSDSTGNLLGIHNESDVFLSGFNSSGNLLVGTSTGNYVANLGSSSGPQLALSHGTGIAQWTFRNAGGNFYLSTTTVVGTATTSISALEIAGSGFGTTTVRGLNIIGQATSTSNVGLAFSSGGIDTNYLFGAGLTSCGQSNKLIWDSGRFECATDLTGGGSGGGSWSTTTSNVAGQNINYSNADSDIITIGANSTTTAEFWFDPNANRAYFGGNVGIGTAAPSGQLEISNVNSGLNLTTYITSTDDARLARTIFRNNTASLQVGQETSAGGSLISGASPSLAYAGVINQVGAYPLQFGTNNTTRMIIDGSGNVGIGTTTPNAALGIYRNGTDSEIYIERGSASNAGYLSFAPVGALSSSNVKWLTGIRENTNDYRIAQYNGSSLSTIATFKSDGTVGIGTTTPRVPLSVTGSATVGGSAPTFAIGDTTEYDHQTYFLSGSSRFGIASQDGTERFSILQSSGNVGIGSTTPATTLSVAGSSYLTGGFGVGLLNTTSGTLQTSGNATIKGGVLAVGPDAGYLNIGTVDTAAFVNTGIYGDSLNGYLGIKTSGSEKVRISNTGLVGIGSTTPWATLAVNPTAGNASNQFVVGSSTATNFIINNSGNVGVGTASPQSKLHIYGAIGSQGQLQIQDSSGTGASASHLIELRDSAGTRQAYLYKEGGSGNFDIANETSSGTANLLRFLNNGTRMVINRDGNVGIGSTTPWGLLSVNANGLSNGAPQFVVGSSTATNLIVTNGGNVGIGTAAPTQKLDVNGNARVTSTLYLGSDLGTNMDGAGATLTLRAGSGNITTGWGTTFTVLGTGGVTGAILSGNSSSYIANNLGVGSTTPGYKLSVAGSGFFDGGTVTASQFVATSSFSAPSLTLSGVAVNSLLSTNSSGVVVATSTPTFGSFNATSTTATSTIAGALTLAPFQPNGTDGVIVFGSANGSNLNSSIFRDTSTGSTNISYAGSSFRVGSFMTPSTLDASTKFIVDSAGKVGVGTTTPWGLLSVNANGLSSGAPQFVVGSSTATNFIVANNGNVGIGTTSPGHKFEVVGNDASNPVFNVANLGNGTFVPAFEVNSPNLTAGNNTYFAVGRNRATNNQFSFGFTYAGNGSAINRLDVNAYGSSALTSLLASGNFGIATTTPTNKLTIADSGASQLSLSHGTGIAQWALRNAGGNFYLSTTTVAGTATTSLSALAINGSNGNVGIGVNNPGYKLDVNGRARLLAGSDISAGVWMRDTANTTDMSFFGRGSDSEAFTGIYQSGWKVVLADTTGNLGIGTTTPTWLLNPTSASASQLALSAGAGVGQWAFRNAGGNFYLSTTTVAGTATSTLSALSISGATGNVGIGVNNPNAQLDVRRTYTTTSDVFGSTYFNSTYNPTGSASGRWFNASIEGYTASGNAQTMTELDAAFVAGYHQGTNTLTYLRGVEAEAYNSSSGTVTHASALRAFVQNAGAGTITNAYGLNVGQIQVFGGAITNAYGVYIDDIQGTNDYGIYQAGTNDTNYFGSFTGIGTTTPWGLLSVNANGLSSGAPQFVVGSSTATNFLVANNGNVGVGATSSPLAQLSIQANSNQYALAIGNALGTSLFVDNTGRVAVGTTNIPSSVGTSKFSVVGSGGTSAVFQDTNNYSSLDVKGATEANITLQDTGAGTNTQAFNWTSNGGTLSLRVLNDALNGVVSTPFGIAASTGNVGIGTGPTSFRLAIQASNNDGVAITNGSDATLLMTPVGSGQFRLKTDLSGRWISFADGDGTTDTMVVRSGRVGVGTTTPGSLLSIGSSGTGTNFFDNSTTTKSGVGGYNISQGCYAINGVCVGGGSSGSGSSASTTLLSDSNTWSGTTNNFTGKVGLSTSSPFAKLSVESQAGEAAFVVGSSTATSLIVDRTGKVGVGTASPTERLTVRDTAGTYEIGSGTISVNSTGNDAFLELLNSGSAGIIIANESGNATFSNDGYMAFEPGYSEAMRISDSGEVSIGTASANGLLTLQGAASGNLLHIASTTNGISSITITQWGGFVQNISSTSAFDIKDGVGNSVFTVDTTAANTSAGLDVTAATGQTANLLNFYSSGGSFLSGFTAAGGLHMNISSSTAIDVLNGSGVAAFVVNSSSKSVGIGTSTLTYNLNVDGSQSATYIARINNAATDTTADGLLISLGVANASRTTGNYFIGFSDGAQTVAGKIQGGASAVAYTTTAADLAEYFAASDPSDLPEKGEIITLDLSGERKVKRADGRMGDKAFGIVSTNPGFIGNGPICTIDESDCDSNYERSNVLVAIAGQVPVKISNENGEVRVGDRLALSSTTPGVAVKATVSGQTLGIAITNATSTLVGSTTVQTVMAYIDNSWQPIGEDFEGGLWSKFTGFLEKSGLTIGQNFIKIVNLVTEKLVANRVETKELCIDEVCINKDQLQALVNNSGLVVVNGDGPSNSEEPAPEPTSTSASTPPVIEEDNSQSTTTPEVIEEEPVVEEESVVEEVPVEETATTTPSEGGL